MTRRTAQAPALPTNKMNSTAASTGTTQRKGRFPSTSSASPKKRRAEGKGKSKPTPSKRSPKGKANLPPKSADFVFYSCPTLSLACQPAGTSAAISLPVAAILTGVHPDKLRYYWRLGLLGTKRDPISSEPILDNEVSDEVVRIEHYRRDLGVERRALHLVCALRARSAAPASGADVPKRHLTYRRLGHFMSTSVEQYPILPQLHISLTWPRRILGNLVCLRR